MKKKLLVTIATLGLLCGGLAGCGGNKESSSEEQKSSAPASSQPVSSSQAPASSSQAPASSSEVKPVESSQPSEATTSQSEFDSGFSSGSNVHTHVWDEEYDVIKAATCLEEGEAKYYCDCGETEIRAIPALGHDWDEGVVTTAATCKKEGIKTFTCKREGCGATKEEPIPVLEEHIWDEGVVSVPATCKDKGVKTFTCTSCGDVKYEEIPVSQEHTWNEGEITTPAKCDTKGVKTYTCSVCGKTKTEDIAMTTENGEHDYQLVGEAVKNVDQKDVYVKACSRGDEKYIGIAFADYSAIDADFDSGANASKYKEVAESIWEDAHMLTKTSGTTISWKINIDKDIANAKLSLGVTSTYGSHGTSDMAGQFSVKVNDGDLTASSITGTYNDNGLDPSKRTYLEFATINLVAGENTITLSQNSTSNRLLFGGEVRIYFSNDATVVEAPIPFEGYNVTFETEHCKVLVFNTKKYTEETPVETNTCLARDENGDVVAYDPDDIALQPQVSFKVVCDEGYSANATNVTVNGTYKNIKQNPDSQEGQENIFRITKVQTDLVISIVAVAGEQAPGYKVDFVPAHCTVKVYVGPKNDDGSNVDTSETIYARSKDAPYNVSFTTPQVNFEVVPDAGYKFESGLEVNGNTTEGVPFISGQFNKITRKDVNVYNLTKVASDLVINVRCIPEAGEAGLGYEITFATEHCQILVYYTQDYRFTPVAPTDNKVLSRTDNGDAAKYGAAVAGVDANADGDYDDEGDVAPVAEVKPQVNFVVVCDEGYEFNSGIDVDKEAKNVSFVSGSYNKVKNVGNGIYRITKIQGDLVVTITATAIAA